MFQEQNQEDNDLAQISSGYKLSKQNFEAMITIKEILQEEVEILNIDVEATHDWIKPLLEYLQNPNLYVD